MSATPYHLDPSSPIQLQCTDITFKLAFKDTNKKVHLNSHKKDIRKLIGCYEASSCQVMKNDLLLFGGYDNKKDSNIIRRLMFNHGVASVASRIVVDVVEPKTPQIPAQRAQSSIVLRHGPHVEYPEIIIFGGICSNISVLKDPRRVKKENENLVDSSTILFSDMWSFSLKTQSWTKIEIAKRVHIAGRSEHSAVYIGGAYDCMLVYGGRTAKVSTLSDMLLFSFKTKQFTKLPQNFFSTDEKERLKSSRKAHTMHLYHDSKVLLVCGHNSQGYHTDVLEYDIGLHRWRLIVDLKRFGFSNRSFHQSALIQDSLLIHGGCFYNNVIDDVEETGYHWVEDTFWIINMHSKVVQKINLNGINPRLTGHCLFFPNDHTLLLVCGSHENDSGKGSEDLSTCVFSIDLNPLKEFKIALHNHLTNHLGIFGVLLEEEKEALARRQSSSSMMSQQVEVNEDHEEEEETADDTQIEFGGMDMGPSITDNSVTENSISMSPELLSEYTPSISTFQPIVNTSPNFVGEEETQHLKRCIANLFLDFNLNQKHYNVKVCTDIKQTYFCDILFLNRIPNFADKLHRNLKGKVVSELIDVDLTNIQGKELELILYFLYDVSKDVFTIADSQLLVRVVQLCWLLEFYYLIKEMIVQYSQSRMLVDIAVALNDILISSAVLQEQKHIYTFLESLVLRTIEQHSTTTSVKDLPDRMKIIVEAKRAAVIEQPAHFPSFTPLLQYLSIARSNYHDFELISQQGVIIPCHKSVLIARSVYLARILELTSVQLKCNISTEQLQLIVDYLYTGIITSKNLKQFFAFVKDASSFEVPGFASDIYQEFCKAKFNLVESIQELSSLRKSFETKEPNWVAEIVQLISSHIQHTVSIKELSQRIVYSFSKVNLDKGYTTILNQLVQQSTDSSSSSFEQPQDTKKRKSIQLQMNNTKKQKI